MKSNSGVSATVRSNPRSKMCQWIAKKRPLLVLLMLDHLRRRLPLLLENSRQKLNKTGRSKLVVTLTQLLFSYLLFFCWFWFWIWKKKCSGSGKKRFNFCLAVVCVCVSGVCLPVCVLSWLNYRMFARSLNETYMERNWFAWIWLVIAEFCSSNEHTLMKVIKF